MGEVSAQQRTYQQIVNGTGFLINRDGYIVTNAHAVNNCQSISVLMNNKAQNAELKAFDQKNDLASIKVNSAGRYISSLRYNITDIKPGDDVIIMGYPGNDGANGKSSYKKTKITGLSGPTGEQQYIQLASVAEHGNSGGPVLDRTGNVIGIISGMATTYHVDASGKAIGQPIGQSDVAITLAALRVFLQQYGIQSYQASSGMVAYDDEYLRTNALGFTVAIRCIQGTIVR